MRDILHIFPTDAAVRAFERQTLAKEGVIFGAPAITLKRLTEGIYRASNAAGRPISTVGRKLMLEEVALARYADGTGLLAGSSLFPGFIGALDGLFGELKQAIVTADDFSKTVRRFNDAERLRELASLYLLYQQALAGRGILDHHDLELAALAHLESGEPLPPMFADVSVVLLHFIYDLTPLQLALLSAISRRIPVRLELPYNPDRGNLYAYVGRTADELELLDDSDLQLEPEFVEPSGRFLTPLLDLMFPGAESIPPMAPIEPMALIAAPGLYRECEEIGRRIRGLLEEGKAPVDIAILFRSLLTYGPMMEDVCRRFGIPVSYRRGAPLFASPLVRTCLAPFNVVRSHFAREELITLCASSYSAPLLDGEGREVPAEIIEEALIDCGYLDETVCAADMLLDRRTSGLAPDAPKRERNIRVRQALTPLLKELRRFNGKQTLRDFTLRLEGFIERRRIYQRGIAGGDERVLRRDASAIALFQQVIAELEADLKTLGLSDRTMNADEFARLLRQGMEGVFLAGERQAGVAIMNFHDARGLGFPHIFIGGLNDGVCPSRHDSHPLFNDSEKLLYQRAASAKLFRTAAEKGAEEPLLFYLAVGCAATSLTLSYSYADSRGNELLRSPYLDELLARLSLPEERIPVNRIVPAPDACLEREELLNALAAGGLFAVGADHPPELAGSLARLASTAAIEKEREEFFAATGRSRRAQLSTPYTGSIRRPDLIKELAAFYETPKGNRFAPTTLEEYGCCPFRYFLRRLLKLKPVEKPNLELEAREEGSLLHEALQAVFLRLQREGELPISDLALARAMMHDETARIFARFEAERFTGAPLLWETGKEQLICLLEQLLEREAADCSGLIPRHFEFHIPELRVEDEDGGAFFLTGKIDRIDTAPEAGTFRVVDYKLAGNTQKYRNLLKPENMGELSFQMPVYLLAAAQALTGEGGAAFSHFIAHYWLLRKLEPLAREFDINDTDESGGLFETDLEKRKTIGDANFYNRLCAKVRAMKEGDFQITPRECEFCDFPSVCRFIPVTLQEEPS
jgi:ATP-dependent helicase/DNAse subunit B